MHKRTKAERRIIIAQNKMPCGYALPRLGGTYENQPITLEDIAAYMEGLAKNLSVTFDALHEKENELNSIKRDLAAAGRLLSRMRGGV